MCRLAAYIGDSAALSGLLDEPEHGLIHQAWAPREMRSASMNADGIGVGWYDDAGRPATYRNVLPAWADVNLDGLGRSLRRPVWMANVRSATGGFHTGVANTQPFTSRRLLFLHNGLIEGFAERLRPGLRQWLTPEIEAGVHGSTDSEYLFAEIRQHHEVAELPLDRAVRAAIDTVAAADARCLLNIAITDGQRIVATRHAQHDECPSLYLCRDPHWMASGQLLASEPLRDDAEWEAVPPHSLVILTPGTPPRMERV